MSGGARTPCLGRGFFCITLAMRHLALPVLTWVAAWALTLAASASEAQVQDTSGLQQGAFLPGVAAAAPPRPAEEEPRPLTVALGVGAGMQYDSRACFLAGQAGGEGVEPDTAPCVLFAGGGDLALLWRQRIGGMIGVYSVSGQAVRTGKEPAIPDRISLPLALEVRPLAFLPSSGYVGRVLAGVGLRAGPSIEILRTASDQTATAGLYLALLGEVPLSRVAQHGVSLRLGLHLITAPRVSLNDGLVRSSPFDACAPQSPEPGCVPAGERLHGVGVVAQTYLGLVYYP